MQHMSALWGIPKKYIDWVGQPILCHRFAAPKLGWYLRTSPANGSVRLASSEADFIEVTNSSGSVDTAGSRRTILEAETLRVRARAKASGFVSMANNDVSFRIREASDVDVGETSILRSQLDIWPTWVQALIGVLASNLVVGAIIRFLLPSSRNT